MVEFTLYFLFYLLLIFVFFSWECMDPKIEYFESSILSYPNNQIIWMYWEDPPGRKKPYYINLCQLLIKRKNPESHVIILNPQNINNYINVPSGWSQLKHIAHRADYARVAILYKYGGIYIDSDMIMLNSLDPIFQLLKKYDFIAYEYQSPLKNKRKKYDINDIKENITKNTYRIPIGFLATKPENPLFKIWLEKINEKFTKTKGHNLIEMGWNNMGRKILNHLAEKLVK